MAALLGVGGDSKDRFFGSDPEEQSHLDLLKTDIAAWNRWRSENPNVVPSYWYEDLRNTNLAGADLRDVLLIEADLREADLRGAAFNRSCLSGSDLRGADATGADFEGANLFQADLRKADFSGVDMSNANIAQAKLENWVASGGTLRNADLTLTDATGAVLDGACLVRAGLADTVLSRCNLTGADLMEANLTRASLDEALVAEATFVRAILAEASASGLHGRGAVFSEANLIGADFSGAELAAANLEGASLIRTNLQGATLDGSFVYGASVWDVILDSDTSQKELVVTSKDEAEVTVDNLKVAQFVHLLLQNQNLRDIIDTVTRKSVLILGRFTPERKIVLDAMRDKLRKLDFVPIVFDFEGSTRRDLRETVKTLAGLSRFIIVDVTNPKSAPLEMDATIPDFLIPVVPIIEQGEKPFPLLKSLETEFSDRVLDRLEYDTVNRLSDLFEPAIVAPALEREEQLMALRSKPDRVRRLDDFA